jgi:hypothetical protein
LHLTPDLKWTPRAKELDAQGAWPDVQNSRQITSSLQQVPEILLKQKQRQAMEVVELPLGTLTPSIGVATNAKELGS